MPALPNCRKLEVRNSPVEGFGVFATDDILKGEILEEVPFVLFPRHTNLSKNIYDLLQNTGFLNSKEKYLENLRTNLDFKEPEKYYFKWYPQVPLDGEQSAFTVLPLGNGPIYNTSNTNNNAGWIVSKKTFIFKAEKDIKKDEEIRTFYGYFVGNDGTIFNCDTVLNLAIDANDKGKAKLRMSRFGSLDQFEQAKQNPSYNRCAQLIGASRDGLSIKRVAAIIPNGEEKASFDIPEDISVTSLYHKIAEFKGSPFPLLKFDFEWDTNDGVPQKESVLFKK